MKTHYHISFENFPGHRVFELTPHYSLASAANFARENFTESEKTSIVEADRICQHCEMLEKILAEDRREAVVGNYAKVLEWPKKEDSEGVEESGYKENSNIDAD